MEPKAAPNRTPMHAKPNACASPKGNPQKEASPGRAGANGEEGGHANPKRATHGSPTGWSQTRPRPPAVNHGKTGAPPQVLNMNTILSPEDVLRTSRPRPDGQTSTSGNGPEARQRASRAQENAAQRPRTCRRDGRTASGASSALPALFRMEGGKRKAQLARPCNWEEADARRASATKCTTRTRHAHHAQRARNAHQALNAHNARGAPRAPAEEAQQACQLRKRHCPHQVALRAHI